MSISYELKVKIVLWKVVYMCVVGEREREIEELYVCELQLNIKIFGKGE